MIWHRDKFDPRVKPPLTARVNRELVECDGLLAYYLLNEAEGPQIHNLAPAARHQVGTVNSLNSTTQWTRTARGPELDNYSSGGRTTCNHPTGISASTQITCLLDFNVDSTGLGTAAGRVVTLNDVAGFGVFFAGINTIDWAVGGDTVFTATIPTVGFDVDTTFTGVAAPSRFEIWVNGVLGNSSAASRTVGTTTADLVLGNRSAGDRTFDGRIGRVILWNRALSQAQIPRLHHEPYFMFAPERRVTYSIAAAASGSGAYWHYYRNVAQTAA